MDRGTSVTARIKKMNFIVEFYAQSLGRRRFIPFEVNLMKLLAIRLGWQKVPV